MYILEHSTFTFSSIPFNSVTKLILLPSLSLSFALLESEFTGAFRNLDKYPKFSNSSIFLLSSSSFSSLVNKSIVSANSLMFILIKL